MKSADWTSYSTTKRGSVRDRYHGAEWSLGFDKVKSNGRDIEPSSWHYSQYLKWESNSL